MSYDDVEGLLTTVGIVATLALSFVIALQFSIGADLVTKYMCVARGSCPSRLMLHPKLC